MEQAMQDETLHEAVARFGSPLNVINSDPMLRNMSELSAVAADREVAFRIYFARKANKCIRFVETASSAGAGLDVASLEELQQVLQTGVTGSDIVCTAAVKDRILMETCVNHGVTVVIDNEDELRLLARLSQDSSHQVAVAIRLSGFAHGDQKLHSRFGFDISETSLLLQERWALLASHTTRIEGLHFHLDGYSAAQRVSAISQCLPIVDKIRSLGHPCSFLDIGGGIPMSYLESQGQWSRFWAMHQAALLGHREPITYRNHGLGKVVVDGEVHGEPNCYPYYQRPVRGDWLAQLLDASYGDATLADAIRDRNVQLRCEPGRSILDGCGMTVARVHFRKRHPSGDWFIGLAMNRTQCRTSSDDFLVDPILIPANISEDNTDSEGSDPKAGFLVGAYCTESELLTLRKLNFPRGVRVGDLVVFPNTAGYLMHFLESRSHQLPLAKNLILTDGASSQGQLDAIDQ
ncbi:MAG: Y4yA family PLP-dependent enzyme [Planctomycetaceae bacterium]|nr:Y4yA family PLP-dependent enzyme [Planctomycetaceae bacterium]